MQKWQIPLSVAIPEPSRHSVVRTAYEGDVEVSTIHLKGPDMPEENGEKTGVRSDVLDTTQFPVNTGNLRENNPELDTTQAHNELSLEDIRNDDLGAGSAQ
jgi:hypothetical protein